MTEEELDMIIFQSHGKEEKALLQLRAERDAAKAALYESCEDERHNELGWVCPLGHKLNEVEAERDALKQDAERYRWLRRARMNVDVLVREDEDSVWLDMHGWDLDAYVDAALAAGGE